MNALLRLSLSFAAGVALVGCSFFRPSPLARHRGALVLVFDTRTAGDVRGLRETLSAHGARATFFAAGQIGRGTANLLKDLRAEGHEIGLSGLNGLDPQQYVPMYGQQKYFQDEIVTQVLDAERQGLNLRHYLLRIPPRAKRVVLALPSFLVSKGFLRVVELLPDYIQPTPVPVRSVMQEAGVSSVRAHLLTAKNFDRTQIAALAMRDEALVVAPSREVLPQLLEEARAQGVPLVSLSDL